jgi:predicted peptidase
MLFSISYCCFSQSGKAYTVIRSEKNDKVKYEFIIPKGDCKKIPVVLYLHGYMENPFIHKPWIVTQLLSSGQCAVFIPCLSPAEGSSAWGGTYDAAVRPNLYNTISEFNSVISKYPVDLERQYIYGWSMGAEGGFRLLTDYPGRFAAAVLVAGYTTVNGAEAMAKTPLWILHGAADKINSVTSSRNIFSAIKKAGGTNIIYTEYPGTGHLSTLKKIQREPGLLEWLLSKKQEKRQQPASGDLVIT